MSELPALSLDEAIASPKKIVLIKGFVSPDVQRVGKLLRSYLGRGELPMYVETLEQDALDPADGQTYCHNNTLALAGDLWKRGNHGSWHILLGDRGPERGPHSWLEFGDAAIDTTFNKMIVSTRQYHHGAAKVLRARGFTGPSGFEAYLAACRQLGLFGDPP
jgi:hypothetical protein